MARLPIPGSDVGSWGDILNDYLSTSHHTDGTLKEDSVGSAQLQDNSVTADQIAPGSITAGSFDGATVIPETHLPLHLSEGELSNTYLPKSEVIRGTGMPEGVVTAAIGVRYIDTASTAGAIEWIKTTPSGNTGWKVVYGDTGWRAVPVGDFLNGWHNIVSPGFDVVACRRVGNLVALRGVMSSGTVVTNAFILPIGFRYPGIHWGDFAVSSGDGVVSGGSGMGTVQIQINGAVKPIRPSVNDWVYLDGISYWTDDAWPSALPGTPAY